MAEEPQQTKVTIKQEPLQTSATVKQEPQQTSATIKQEPLQTSATIKQEPLQTSATIKPEPQTGDPSVKPEPLADATEEEEADEEVEEEEDDDCDFIVEPVGIVLGNPASTYVLGVPAVTPLKGSLRRRSEEEMSKRPDWLPPGWRIELRRRSKGKSAGIYDPYYYSPSGKRYRSKVEVLACLKEEAKKARLASGASGSGENESGDAVGVGGDTNSKETNQAS